MTLAELIHEHRMLNTFGGYDWGDPIRLWTVEPVATEPKPKPKPRRIAWDDLLEELEWFRASGVSGAIALKEIGVTSASTYRRCQRHGRPDLASWIDATTNRHSSDIGHEWKEAA